MKNEQCEGVYHIGLCYFGVPITVSNGHFLYASNYIENEVIGINPDLELHESFMNIEMVMTFSNEKFQSIFHISDMRLCNESTNQYSGQFSNVTYSKL